MYAYNSSFSRYLNIKKNCQNFPSLGKTSHVGVESLTTLWANTGLIIRIQDSDSISSVLLLAPWGNHLMSLHLLMACQHLSYEG